MGYYLVDDDMIKINGVSLNNIDMESLHKLTGILFQDYCKFELPVRDNVGFGNIDEIENDSQIIKSLKKADVDFLSSDLNQQLGKWFQKNSAFWWTVAEGCTSTMLFKRCAIVYFG